MLSSATHLIVGGDGLIGAALSRMLISHGKTVLATTRRDRVNSNSDLHLDLRDDVRSWKIPPHVQTAYFCAAVTKARECEQSRGEAYRVNIESTLQISEKLLESGAFVVFLSTNSVFSGMSPHYKADAPYAPANEYGRLKAEAEQRLLALGGSIAIVRLTKVLDGGSSLIGEWIRNIKNQIQVNAFNDMYFAPISLPYAINALCAIGTARRAGVYQLSGRTDLSYAEFAKSLAKRLGFSQELVNETSSHTNTAVAAAGARYSTLDMTLTTSLLGIAPQSVEDVVDYLVK